MNAPAPVRPVLRLRPESHDRHAVLYRLYERVRDNHGTVVAARAVFNHSAILLAECECDEGSALRVAVRRWAGLSEMDRRPIRVKAYAGAPRLEGERPRLLPTRAAAKYRGRAKTRVSKGRVWLRSEQYISVAPEYVLYLAGWPTELTGVEFCPML